MAYRIEGLAPQPFQDLFGMSDAGLAERNAVRVTADAPRAFPCRVTLEDATEGEHLILLNHVSHDFQNPYRAAHAIYVRESATTAAVFIDGLPTVFEGRPLSLRGFDVDGMLQGALLALPGEADAKIRELLARPDVATIHAHNAAPGCFAARIERN